MAFPSTTRVLVTLADDGVVAGKVTAHSPYAAADELPSPDPAKTDTPAPALPEASADVALDELPPDVGPALVQQLQDVLTRIRAAAADRLARRLADSVATARQVAQQRGEITR